MTRAPAGLFLRLAAGPCAAWIVAGCGLAQESPAELGVYDPTTGKDEPARANDGGGLDAPPPSEADTPPLAPDAGAPVPPDAGAPGPSAASVSTESIAYDDGALRCFELTAHAGDDQASPYLVPTSLDHYVRFTFAAPWTGTQYVRSFEAVILDARFIHHATLFEQPQAIPEGVSVPQELVYPNAQLVYAWDPGIDKLYFQPEVGLRVTGGGSYTLEIHYNNQSGAPAPDRSGLKLCVTPTKPAYVVSLSRLGTQLSAGNTAIGTCSPEHQEPISVIALRPQLGVKGRRATVVVQRQGGAETALDEPFAFDNGTLYPTDLKLQPGETLTTTCTYSERVSFGPAVSDERCDLFAIHWPADTLINARSIAVDGWLNTCLY